MMKWNAITIAVSALVFCLAIAVLGWIMWPTPVVTPTTDIAQPLPQEALPTVEVPGTKTQKAPAIIAKEKTQRLRDKTKLPPGLFDAPETYLLANSTLQSEEERKYTLTSVLDRRTGETQIYAVAEPLPWIGMARQTELAIGYTLNGIEIKARQDIIRAKRIFAYAEARANEEEQNLGVYAGWRF